MTVSHERPKRERITLDDDELDTPKAPAASKKEEAPAEPKAKEAPAKAAPPAKATSSDEQPFETPPQALKLRKYLEIDVDELDDTLARDPQDRFDVGELSSIARSKRDVQKEELGRMELRVRNRVKEKLHEKATQADISAAIETDEEWKRERTKYLRLCFECDVYSELVDAFRTRGLRLHNLSDLEVSRGKSIRGQSERGT